MQPLRLALLICTLCAGQAQAGLLDDDEARRAIADLKAKNEARFDQQGKAQLDLANQQTSQAEEIARLRQQDFYLDLDSRLRKLEPAAGGSAAAPGEAAPAAAADPAVESQTYEAALNFFKAGKYKEAGGGFASFLQKFPESSLAPNAYYWLGNAWHAQRNCPKALEVHSVVTTKYPSNPKAADAWLAIATCQQDMGNAAAARRSLDTLIAKYPGTPAAESAQQRLKKK
jgi:tol-pal system protein YbgF